jgi:hypothetical protein
MAIDTSLPISNKGTNGSPITDSGGNPLQGVEVSLWRRVLKDTNSDGEGDEITDTKLLARKQTDSNGEYEFTESDLPTTYIQGESEVIYYCTVHAVRVASGSGDPLDNGRIKACNATNEPAASDYMAAYSLLENKVPVTNGLVHHYKAYELTLADGDAVGTWADDSGGGNDLTQNTSASKPTYKEGVVGGFSAVRSDGSDDFMKAPSPMTQPFTIFIVAQFDNPTDGELDIFYSKDDATSADGRLLSSGEWSIQSDISGGSNDGSSFYLLMMEHDTDDSQIRVNKSQVVAGTAADEGYSSSGLVMFGWGTENFLTAMDLAEFVGYDRELASTEISDVEEYLNGKYGLGL